MIQQSFIFLEGVNKKTEQNIWQQGVTTWESFLIAQKIMGISKKRKLYYDKKILEAKKELYLLNASYFIDKLPSVEMWRLYSFFKEDAVFLDIEVDAYDIILIGLYDGIDTKIMVKGVNLEKKVLLDELKKYKLIITFNGKSFDLPKIKKYSDISELKIPVIDLKHVCSRLGLTGGLKKVEKRLGITRPSHLYGNPVDLWKAYHASGDREYLELLVQYNEEDIINLKPVMEWCYKECLAVFRGG